MHLAILIPSRANPPIESVVTWMPMISELAGCSYSIHTISRSHVHVARQGLLMEARAAGADWFFWIDDDAVLPSKCLTRLWAHSGEAGIIVPWFVARSGRSVTWNLEMTATGPGKRSLALSEPLERGEGVRWIGATGFHTVLMSRAAVEAVLATAPMPFEVEVFADARSRGEDIAFFQHVHRTGMRVLQDCNVEVGHVTTSVVGDVR